MDNEELHREIILDHHRRPRRFGQMSEATHRADGVNPYCADSIQLQLKVEEGRIVKAVHQTEGCALSRASASLMAEMIEGLTFAEAESLAGRLYHTLVGEEHENQDALPGDLEALTGVRQFPRRVPCVMMAWDTLKKAIEPCH